MDSSSSGGGVLGTVVERNVDAMPMPMPIPSSSSRLMNKGFPVPAAMPRKGAVKTTIKGDAKRGKAVVDEMFIARVRDDDEYNNANTVVRWSEEELLIAMTEVSNIMSSKNMEALKKRAQQVISNQKAIGVKPEETNSVPTNSYSGHTTTTTTPSASKLDRSQLLSEFIVDSDGSSCDSKLSTKKVRIVASASNLNVVGTEANNSNVPHYIASTYDELKKRQREVPDSTRATFAWTLDEDVNDREQPQDDKQRDLLAQITLSRIKHDRFDLQGRRVVKAVEVNKNIREAVNDTFLRSLSKECLDNLISHVVETMLRAGIAIEHVVSAQPQDELLNHEFDRDKPGFTFQEISEMFRSEVPNQRLMATKMFTGILATRDDVVTSECMGYPRSAMSSRYRQAYDEVVDYAMKLLSREGVCSSEYSANDMKRVKRVLTFSLLFLCAADLPADLPVLLLWGQSIRTSGTAKLATLECMKRFLSSSSEEEAAAEQWLGLWGLHGCPSLCVPHGRRVEDTYECHMETCKHNFLKQVDSEDDDMTYYEKFALRCRWSRVDTMVLEGHLLGSLVSVVQEGADIMSSISLGCACKNEQLIVLQSAIAALETLCCISRNGSSDVIKSTTAAVEKLCSRFYGLKIEMVEDASTSKEILASRSTHNRILSQWFRLLAELGRRDRRFVERFWTGDYAAHVLGLLYQGNSYIASSTSASDNSNIDQIRCCIIWVCRLLRVAMGYRLGLHLIVSLIIAARMDHGGIGFRVAGSSVVVNNDVIAAEVVWLFEEAAFSISNLFTSLSSNSSSSSMVLGDTLEAARLLISTASPFLNFVSNLLNQADTPVTAIAASHFVSTVMGFSADVITHTVATELHRSIPLRGSGLVAASKLLLNISQGVSLADAYPPQVVTAMTLLNDGIVCFLATNELVECTKKIFQMLMASQPLSSVLPCALLAYERTSAVNRLLVTLLTYGLCDINDREWDSFHQRMAMVASQVDSGVSVVTAQSQGVVMWKLSRLLQMNVLCSMEIAILAYSRKHINDKQFIAWLEESLSKLGQGFSGPISAALDLVVGMMLINGNMTSEILVSDGVDDHLSALKGTICQRLLNDDSSKGRPLSISYGRSLVEDSNESLNVWTVDSLDDVPSLHNPLLPLSTFWPFDCLLNLKGRHLARWLQTLSTVHTAHRNNESPSYPASSSAAQLYKLLKLCTPSEASRWFQDSDDVNTLYVIHPEIVDDGAVDAYRLLLDRILGSARLDIDSFTDAMSQVSQQEVSSFATNNKKGSVKAEAGIVTLCAKLLDSITADTTLHEVNSAALSIMVTPLMPWRVRDKVWRELGSLRLIDLLDGPHWQQCENFLALAMVPEKSSHSALTRSIVAALLSLRVEGDRFSVVACIGIHLVAMHVFGLYSIISNNNIDDIDSTSPPRPALRGVYAEMFLDIVRGTSSSSSWLVADILTFATVAIRNRVMLHQLASRVHDPFGGINIVDQWKQYRLTSSSSSDCYCISRSEHSTILSLRVESSNLSSMSSNSTISSGSSSSSSMDNSNSNVSSYSIEEIITSWPCSSSIQII